MIFPSVLSCSDGLPYECQSFSAYLKLSCLFIRDHTLVGGKDCCTKTAQHSRDLVLANVYTQAGFGDSLQAGDDLLGFVRAVFSGNADGLEAAVLDDVIFCNIAFVQ